MNVQSRDEWINLSLSHLKLKITNHKTHQYMEFYSIPLDEKYKNKCRVHRGLLGTIF